MVKKVCVNCGGNLRSKHPRAKHCSDKCKNAWRIKQLPKRKCHHCGKSYKPTGVYQLCCSKSCGVSHANPSRIVICQRCSLEFRFHGRGGCRFCPKCRIIDGSLRAYKHSIQTGKVKNPGVGSGGVQRGAANHQWKGGKTRYAVGYRALCYSVWPKHCSLPGCVSKGLVVVHHLDGDPKNSSLDNLLPLCALHHRRLHASIRPTKEQYVQAFLSMWPEGRSKIAEKIGEARQRVIRGEGQQEYDQPQRLGTEITSPRGRDTKKVKR